MLSFIQYFIIIRIFEKFNPTLLRKLNENMFVYILYGYITLYYTQADYTPNDINLRIYTLKLQKTKKSLFFYSNKISQFFEKTRISAFPMKFLVISLC